MEIGWIGLGQIGTEMIKRLLASGFSVMAYSRGQGVREAVAAGARLAEDYRRIAEMSDLVFLCVYDEEQLLRILLDEALLESMRPGSTIIVHTTASPNALIALGARAAPRGVAVLDACFSGGPAEVASGSLTLMAGGISETLEMALPALKTYCAKVDLVGKLGDGQMLKLLNNLLFATNLMNAAQVVSLARDHGLAPGDVASIISDSSGASYAMGLFSRAGSPEALLPAIRHYLEKDVASAASAAKTAGLDINSFAETVRYFSRPQPE